MAERCPISLSGEPTRESPAPEPLHCGLTGPSRPDASNEPTLNIDNIQGNILSGFMKDNQAFVFLTLEDHQIANFKEWLATVRPFIATEAELIAFNRLFKAIRTRRKGEPTGVKATWINIAFSYRGLRKLIPETLERQDFEDEAFKAGLAQRSLGGILGDPSTDAQKGAEGHPDNWVLGGPKEELHAVLIVASDDEAEVNEDPASKSTLSQLLHGSKDFPRGLASFGKFKVQQGR